jgi:hypothetical protein
MEYPRSVKKSKSIQRRFATDDEKIALDMLRGCRFPVASWDKRFIRHLGEVFYLLPEASISDGEAPQLWRIFIKYRAQMRGPELQRLLPIAQKLAAPDFRKLNAATREQAEIDQLKQKYQEAMKQ